MIKTEGVYKSFYIEQLWLWNGNNAVKAPAKHAFFENTPRRENTTIYAKETGPKHAYAETWKYGDHVF